MKRASAQPRNLCSFPSYQSPIPIPRAQKQLLTPSGHVRIHLDLASGLFCIMISYLAHVSLYIFEDVSVGSVLYDCPSSMGSMKASPQEIHWINFSALSSDTSSGFVVALWTGLND